MTRREAIERAAQALQECRDPRTGIAGFHETIVSILIALEVLTVEDEDAAAGTGS